MNLAKTILRTIKEAEYNPAREGMRAAKADAAYHELQKVIGGLLDECKQALAKHEQRRNADPKLNWGYIGELGHVEQNLRDVLAFLRNSYNG